MGSMFMKKNCAKIWSKPRQLKHQLNPLKYYLCKITQIENSLSFEVVVERKKRKLPPICSLRLCKIREGNQKCFGYVDFFFIFFYQAKKNFFNPKYIRKRTNKQFCMRFGHRHEWFFFGKKQNFEKKGQREKKLDSF